MESNMIEDLPEKHKRFDNQEPQWNRAEIGKLGWARQRALQPYIWSFHSTPYQNPTFEFSY